MAEAWWLIDPVTGRARQVTGDDPVSMMAPYECARCSHVHDAADVEVEARYADCSVWRCPNCRSQIDDRPVRWGGSAHRLNADGTRR